MMTRAELARRFIHGAKGRFFNVEFIKKNGDLRKMVCRTGVAKDVKGVQPDRWKEDLKHDVLTVFDVNVDNGDGKRGNYRRINLPTVLTMRTDGMFIDFVKNTFELPEAK